MGRRRQERGRTEAKTRSKTLRQAASLVFAVTAILPLLVFVLRCTTSARFSRLSVQVGLGVALATSLMGYYVFRGSSGKCPTSSR